MSLQSFVTLDMGKLIREAQAEVDLSADILGYYADHAKRFLAPQKLKIDTGGGDCRKQASRRDFLRRAVEFSLLR